ncbi:MAG TPA: IF-2 protein [Myxococcaceae bacterium]|nr:IF-2 protein [Myxococcaceae bacterium]
MRSIKKLVITLLVLGLGGAVVFLLSQLNARSYRVEAVDGNLVVMKGRLLPTSSEVYRPGDPALREAYAPLPLDGTSPGNLVNEEFTERDQLDRALFEVVSSLARARITSDDPSVLEQGLYYLRRADKLTGATEEQRQSLKVMHSEVAYYLARSKLDQARNDVAEAISQLKLAATTSNRHAHNANQMIMEVEPAAKAFEEAMRRAAHGLSAPAFTEPTNPSFAPPSAVPPQAKPPLAPSVSDLKPKDAG